MRIGITEKRRTTARLKRRCQNLPAGLATEALDHARVLGLRGKVTFTDIKRHYRQRMLEYHPDRVASLGPKIRELAEIETKKINAAYEFFTAQNAANRNI